GEGGGHGGEHGGDRGGPGAGGIRVGEPAQDGQALAGGVRARGKPLMRQRLPGREVGHAAGGQQGAEGPGQLLRLPGGGGDREQEPRGGAGQAGERRGEERPERGRSGHVRAADRDNAAAGRGQVRDPAELGVVGDGGEETGEAHGIPG